MAIILAIDRGKFNSAFCGFDPSTGEVEFRTAATTPFAMRAELLRRPVERVVIEACSPAEWVHDLCGELGLRCDVANTAEASKNVKRKADRDDALITSNLKAELQQTPIPIGNRPTAPRPSRA